MLAVLFKLLQSFTLNCVKSYRVVISNKSIRFADGVVYRLNAPSATRVMLLSMHFLQSCVSCESYVCSDSRLTKSLKV